MGEHKLPKPPPAPRGLTLGHGLAAEIAPKPYVVMIKPENARVRDGEEEILAPVPVLDDGGKIVSFGEPAWHKPHAWQTVAVEGTALESKHYDYVVWFVSTMDDDRIVSASGHVRRSTIKHVELFRADLNSLQEQHMKVLGISRDT